MARIELRIGNPANRITLKTMLEAEGHRIGTDLPEVIFCDDLGATAAFTDVAPVLVLVQAGEIPDAVRAMRQGVYGYVLLPFQPREACMMVDRALAAGVPQHGAALRTLHDVELEHIHAVLRSCKNNHSVAARVLGVGRNTLWRKLKDYDAKSKSPDKETR